MTEKRIDELQKNKIESDEIDQRLDLNSLLDSEDARDLISKPTVKPDESQSLEDKAMVQGSGAIAQGQGAMAVGERGIHTDGNVEGSNVTGKVETGGGNFTGRDTINNFYDKVEKAEDRTSLPIITSMERETIERIECLFVSSPRYLQFVDNNQELQHRVFLINGAEQADTFSCAVKTGLDLSQSEDFPQFYTYKRQSNSSHLLLDFVNYKDLSGNAVFILENVFETGIQLSDLSEKFIDAINSKLKEKNGLLILTTNYSDDRLIELTALNHLNAQIVNLGEVLQKYLDYYQESDRYQLPELLVTLAKQNDQELLRRLQSTLQIEQFCVRLSQLSLESDSTSNDEKKLAKQIVDLAERVGNASHETLRQWFASLSLNHKLFAILVVLLPNLEVIPFADFYYRAVQKLRDQEVPLDDPRKQGIAEILTMINAVETASGHIHFTSPVYRQETQNQIRNYYLLLWSLIELLLDIIKEFTQPEYWELRSKLGGAIGLIGIEHQPKLADRLKQIAKSDIRGIQVVSGYALAEIAHQKKHHSFVIKQIKTWAQSGQTKLMWTATASIWRVYDNFAKHFPPLVRATDNLADESEEDTNPLAQLAKILTYLAQTTNDTEIVLGIVHALRFIAQNHAIDVVEIIKSWLNHNSGEQLRFLGRLVAFDLFYTNSRSEVLPTQHQHKPLLDLIRPLLMSEQVIVNVILSTLQMWAKDSEWLYSIHNALLHIANDASDSEHQALRESIVQNWMTSDLESATQIKQIGQALLLRSYVMQGFPIDLPSTHFNVLAIDNTRIAKSQLHKERLAERLYHHMAIWNDVKVIQLGSRQARLLSETRSSDNWSQLFSRHPTPRLIYPALEETCDILDSPFTTIVCCGSVADFEDAFPSLTSVSPCILAIEAAIEWPKRLNKLEINDISQEFLCKLHESFSVLHLPLIRKFDDMPNFILVWLHSQVARNLASRDANIWWGILAHHFPQGPDNLDKIYVTLDNWALDLTQHEFNTFPDDSARRIACTVMWLAVANIEECVRFLIHWIEDAIQNRDAPFAPRQLLAIACTKILFDLYGTYATELSPEKAFVLLRLLPVLKTVPNLSLVKIILITIRHWLTVRGLHNELTNTNSETFKSLAELLCNPYFEQKRDEMLAILQHWKYPLKQRREEDTPNTIIQLAEQLSLYLFTSDSGHLPQLEAKQQYAFIVIDASGTDSPERRHLTLVAKILIEELRKNTQKLMIVMFHLGSIYPIPISNNGIEAEKLLPSGIEYRPRLLAPILEQTSIDNVNFVLVLTGGSILDQADWEKKWQERVKIYSVRNAVSWSGDLEVYPYLGQQAKPDSQSTIEAVVKMIEMN